MDKLTEVLNKIDELKALAVELREQQTGIIRVPDGIEIIRYPKGSIGIQNRAKQVLTMRSSNPNNWLVVPSIDSGEEVPCKLTLCEREDLVPGDIAFVKDADDSLQELGRYRLIIGTERDVFWWNGAGNYNGIHESGASWDSWYKVEPIE